MADKAKHDQIVIHKSAGVFTEQVMMCHNQAYKAALWDRINTQVQYPMI